MKIMKSTMWLSPFLTLLMEAPSSMAFVVPIKTHPNNGNSVSSPSFSTSPPIIRGLASSSLSLLIKSPSSEIIEDSNMDHETRVPNTNPTPVMVAAWNKLWESSSSSSNSVPAMFTTLALAAALSFATVSPDAAWAARSGGRMGGSFGSAAPRMSAPSRSYGGGGGYYGGGGGGIRVAPIIPIPGPSFYGPPIVSPYYGGGLAVPFRGPSFFDLLFFGGFAFVALSALSSTIGSVVSRTSAGNDFWSPSSGVGVSALGSGVTVAQMNIALEVPNRDDRNSILSVLDRLAQTAQTDKRVGIQNLTSQVALELLRRKSSIVSAYADSKHFRGGNVEQAQREFNSRAVQERGKFEEETVSRYGGVDYAGRGGGPRSAAEMQDGGKATMAVVTLVVAIEGDSTKLPNIRSMADVEEALARLASDVKVEDCLQSAEILWTPQDRSEVLTSREVIADYPKLTSV